MTTLSEPARAAVGEVVIMREWAVGLEPSNGYTAPELLRPALIGYAINHPKRGTLWIRTSAIESVNGCTVTTHSGTVYLLEGPPHENYLKWLKDNGREYDAENPIKVVRHG